MTYRQKNRCAVVDFLITMLQNLYLFIVGVVSLQGSRFYENEMKREQQVNQRIEKMMLQKAQITEQQLKKAQAQVRRVRDLIG